MAFELLGYTMLDPWFIAGIPAVLLLLAFRLRRQRAALPAASLGPFAGLPVSLRQRLVHGPVLLLALSACVLSVAMARPVLREVVPLREEGIDILLVVDISSSMDIKDMESTSEIRRVDAARSRAEEFAAARMADRVGLLTFSRYAELRCPMTLDERALAAFLRVVETVPQNTELDGTAIGTAMAKAARVLGGSAAASRVVVLLSDGENTVQDILPLDGARLCADAGIRVHTIGLGNGTPSPLGGMIPLEFTDLQQIAQKTGGRFFRAANDQDLGEVYAAIDQLEKSALEDPRYRTTDAFEVPLLWGLGLLLAGLLLEFLWIRPVP